MKRINQYLAAIVILILVGVISYSKPEVKTEIIKETNIDIVWWNSLNEKWKNYFINTFDINPKPTQQDFEKIKHIEVLDRLADAGIHDLTPIKELKNVKRLWCGEGNLVDLTPIATFDKLEELYIGGSSVVDICPLENLKSLKKPEMYGTKIADLSALSELKNLEFLDCSSTKITDLTGIENLENLKILYLNSTPLKSLKGLKNLTNIEETVTTFVDNADGTTGAPAANFRALDCDGVEHDLFEELNDNTIVVMAWVMPCSTCISDPLAALNIVEDYATSHPGRVVFYLIDDYANTDCFNLSGWADFYGLGNATKFSDESIKMTNYGVDGMPKIIVVGGANHQIYFDEEKSYEGVKEAIDQALEDNP